MLLSISFFRKLPQHQETMTSLNTGNGNLTDAFSNPAISVNSKKSCKQQLHVKLQISEHRPIILFSSVLGYGLDFYTNKVFDVDSGLAFSCPAFDRIIDEIDNCKFWNNYEMQHEDEPTDKYMVFIDALQVRNCIFLFPCRTFSWIFVYLPHLSAPH
jgi:hypothetical protein